MNRVPGIQLIIVDPITAYLGETDSHNNAEIRGLLMPLAALAAKYHVAIIGVSHLNKSQGNAMYRTMGSLGMIAASRGAWLVTKDQDNDQRRLFLPLKNNLGPDHGGLAYHIEGNGTPRVVWEDEPVHITAAEALAAREDSPELDDAVSWLRNTLTEGVLSAKEIQEQAKDAGHSWRTVRRAQGVLKIKPAKTRFDGGWEWKLPKMANANAITPPSLRTLDTFDTVGHLRVFPEGNMVSAETSTSLFPEDAEDVQGGQGGQGQEREI